MSKLKKGDFFTIDVDAYLAEKLAVLRGWKFNESDMSLKGKTFQVHRIEYGTTIIYDNGTGLTGVNRKFCQKVSAMTSSRGNPNKQPEGEKE
jgi:hypothetical protein